MFELAVQRAKELDDHLRKTGELVGPLHGLPISLKDQFDVEGVDSSMGKLIADRALRAELTVFRRLRVARWQARHSQLRPCRHLARPRRRRLLQD